MLEFVPVAPVTQGGANPISPLVVAGETDETALTLLSAIKGH